MHPAPRGKPKAERLRELAAQRQAEAEAKARELRSLRYRLWFRGQQALAWLLIQWGRLMLPRHARAGFLEAVDAGRRRGPAAVRDYLDREEAAGA